MPKTWKSGEMVALRGIYNGRVWYIQSAIVVHDTPKEVALVILPGAECFAPEGYIHGKHGAEREWDRWGDYLNDNWKMERYAWQTNRLLILLEPERYYSSIYFWLDATNQFLCYYINFQLPFQRSDTGFDTFDLELDIIVEPTFEWHWKDVEGYQKGIDRGVILKEWITNMECARDEIFEKIEKRKYPLDGSWLNWKPNPSWPLPELPEEWSKV